MTTDSGITHDAEQGAAAEADAGDVKQPTTGVQGQRIIKALTKVEDNKKKRTARQEQVYRLH